MFILRRGKHVLSNYFLAWFFELLPSEHTDEINDEFRLYQSLTAIPEELDTSQIYEEDHITADILCNKSRMWMGKISLGWWLAKLVLILPRSNADEVFSTVWKNRANLSLTTTLPSILQCKLNAFSHIKCYKYNPTQVLRNSKQATWQYNREHANSSWLHTTYCCLSRWWRG
jgi:hypothetical protein